MWTKKSETIPSKVLPNDTNKLETEETVCQIDMDLRVTDMLIGVEAQKLDIKDALKTLNTLTKNIDELLFNITILL
jgi:hypothetical protein